MKAPTKQLTPEVRRKVAEACGWPEHGRLGIFDPEHNEVLWKSLTHKLAQVIREEISRSSGDRLAEILQVTLVRFNYLLATNDAFGLEALLAELMGETE